MGYTKEVSAFLKSHGFEKVESIEVTRTPLSSKIDTLLNLITLGKFTEAKKKAEYDKLFHLAITISTPSGNYQIEKNETIRAGKIHGQSSKTERMHVIPKNVSVGQLLERARAKMGDHDFFTYSAFQHNCQDFVLNVLKASHLLTEKVEHFVKQDPAEILKHLPSYTEKLANILTDLASIFSGIIPETKRHTDVPQHSLKPNYKVLAVYLSKEHFTKEDAQHWIAQNHFKVGHLTEFPQFYQFRQMTPPPNADPKRIKLGNKGYMVVIYT